MFKLVYRPLLTTAVVEGRPGWTSNEQKLFISQRISEKVDLQIYAVGLWTDKDIIKGDGYGEMNEVSFQIKSLLIQI